MTFKHILIVSSGVVTTKNSFESIFQKEEAKLLSKFGYQVSLMSAGFLPLRISYIKDLFSSFKSDYKVRRFYLFLPLPLRYVPKIILSSFNAYILYFSIKRYIKDFGLPEVIHYHNVDYAGFSAKLVKSNFPSIFLLLTEHNSTFIKSYLSNVGRLNCVLENIDKFTVVSQEFRSQILSQLSINVTIDILNNPISSVFRVDPSISKFSNFTIVSVGSFTEVKNHVSLIKAFQLLVNRGVDFNLVLVGGGPLINEYRELLEADQELLKRVRIIDFLQASELCELFNKCHLYVHVSSFESFGLSALEAIKSGLPAVTGNTGVISRFTDSYAVEIVANVFDFNLIANAILILRERISLNSFNLECAKIASIFSEEEYLNNLNNLFNNESKHRNN